MNCNPARRGITRIVVRMIAIALLAFSLAICFTPASASAGFAAPVAGPHAQSPLCGDGSAPDYGFTYDLQQAHWLVGWEGYASQQAVAKVDAILDQLNADSIAQTMILILPQEQVGNRVNCAVHFLRYMQLGQPTGERKDNGFVFLIVVEPTAIDVHYGVGLGLPALTASDLTTLNRAAEDAYQPAHNMNQALLALAQGFDGVARSKYAPLVSLTPTPEMVNLPQLPSGPLGILVICGLVCLGIPALLFLVWLLMQLARMGIIFNPSGFGGMGGPFGGGRSGGGGWGGGGGSFRGGSGSGRSGRGN